MNALFFIFLSIFFFCSSNCHAETIDRIVAIVDEEVITLSELNEKIKPIIAKNFNKNPTKQELQVLYNQILPQLIDEKIVENEIKKRNLKISDEDVDFAINNILAQNSLTKDQLIEKLKEDGIDFDTYRKEIRNQILRSRLVNFAVKAKVVVSEEEIDNFIKKEMGKENEKTTEKGDIYVLGQIAALVKDTNNQKELEMAENKIKIAQSELEKGKSFMEVAKEHSDLYDENKADKGIIAGAFLLEEMSPTIRDHVKKMKVNEITPVIKTSSGFFIFTLKDKKAQDKNFSKLDNEKRNQIREYLYREKLNQTFQDWIKDLRSKTTIKILL